MGFISGKDKSIAPRNIVGGFAGGGSGFLGGGGNISIDEVAYVRLSSDVNEPLAGLNPIDGVTPTEGDLILCMSQIDPAFRAVYVASAMLWEEKVYASNPKIIIVEEGVTNGETAWIKVESETDSWDYVKIESGGLPAGALGNTMYHNGIDWVANDKFNYSEPTTSAERLALGDGYGLADSISMQSGITPTIMVGNPSGSNGGVLLNKSFIEIQNSTGVGVSISVGTIKTIFGNIQSEMTTGYGFKRTNVLTSVNQARLHENYLQALNLNNTGKQKNILISASGHIQSKNYDRTRIDTAVPFSTVSLFEIMNLQPTFSGSVTTALTKTYSYKFKFKLFVTFNTTGGQGGFKLNLTAKSGANIATFETPSMFKISPLGGGISVDDHYADVVDYNSTVVVADLSQYDNRACMIEGEAWVNDFAFDNIIFGVEVAQNTLVGSFEVGVGSYCDYEVCNTDNQ